MVGIDVVSRDAGECNGPAAGAAGLSAKPKLQQRGLTTYEANGMLWMLEPPWEKVPCLRGDGSL